MTSEKLYCAFPKGNIGVLTLVPDSRRLGQGLQCRLDVLHNIKTEPTDRSSTPWWRIEFGTHSKALDEGCYDALSYAWGDVSRKNQVPIICNGHSIRIRRNLFLALHQIWAHWPWKGIWADVICINQEGAQQRIGRD